MKKILALLLSLIITASVMTSCGNGGKNSEPESQQTPSLVSEVTDESKSDESEEETIEILQGKSGKKDISQLAGELKNQKTASLTFNKNMDVELFAGECGSDYDTDESHTKMTIEELGGIPMLRIQTLDKNKKGYYKVPKIQFHMYVLFGDNVEDIKKISKIKMDVVTKAVGPIKNEHNEECMVPAFFGGKLATMSSYGWNELIEFGDSQWDNDWQYYQLETPKMEKDKYFDEYGGELVLMKWSIINQQDLYIANITFLDEDGNVVDCTYGK